MVKDDPINVAAVKSDIKIDVYYKNEEDFKNKDVPLEIIITFPDYCRHEPIKLSDNLPIAFGIKDTTEEQEINEKALNRYKLRTASIDVYGAVNYHVGDPEDLI